MSDPQAYAPPPAASSPATPPPAPRRSCLATLAGFIGWVFTLILSVGLALAAVGAIAYFLFGFDLQTPGRIIGTPAELAALRDQNATAQAQIGALQTEVALQSAGGSTSAERLDELEARLAEAQAAISQAATAVAEVRSQAEQVRGLSDDLDQSIATAAALQDQARDGQVQVAVFATVQAANTLRLDEVERSTDRLIRFLARLGDIVGDTQGDLAATQPAGPEATPTAATPEVSPTPTGSPEATPSPTPTARP